jgi:hypothetical protein
MPVVRNINDLMNAIQACLMTSEITDLVWTFNDFKIRLHVEEV